MIRKSLRIQYTALSLLGVVAMAVVACAPAAAPSPTAKPAEKAAAPAEAAKPAEKAAAPAAAGDDTIKVGILHSLSGTMAISETSVRDAELMAIDEINAAGGEIGRAHV